MTVTHALGWALLNFLWQGAAIALGLRLALFLLPARSARLRYGAALTALALMPALVLGSAITAGSAGGWAPGRPGPSGYESVPGELSGNSAAAGSNQSAGASGPGTISTQPPAPVSLHDRIAAMLPTIVLAWFIGVVLLALRHLGGLLTIRQLTRRGIEEAPASVRQAAARLATRLGIRRPVTVLASTVAQVPGIVGWLRPVVLLPASVASGFTSQQIELLLAHELAHIRRYDYLVNLVQSAIESLLFYHPGVWWVSARVREEREHCCDDLAVRATGDALRYAETLLALEELRRTSLPAPALGADGGSLAHRVRRLLVTPEREAELMPRWLTGAFLMLTLVGGLTTVRLADASAAPATADDPAADLIDAGGEFLPAAPGDTAGLAPDTVIRHPDPNAPLRERYDWAVGQAAKFRTGYWIGYTVQSLFPGGRRTMYMGRLSRHAARIGGMSFTGRFTNFGDFDNLGFPGVPVLSLVGGRPDDVAILLGFDRTGQPVARVHASTAALPVDFEQRPLLWLGRSDDSASVGLLRRLWDGAGGVDPRSDLVGAIGLHRTSSIAVPFLIGVVQSREADPVREFAAEWLGRHADRAGLAALTRAARGDRSDEIRREAAEAVGDVELPEAADSLIALARTLDQTDVRSEAVEALAEREEPAALRAATEIARRDRSSDVRREAVETLGEFSERRGLPALLDIVRDHPDVEARREAVETIGEAATPDSGAVILFRIARDDRSDDVAREAVETLGELHDTAGLPAIRTLLRDHPSPSVRAEAIETITDIAPNDILDLLRKVANSDPSEDVQHEAVEALGQLDDPRAVVALTEIAERHPSVGVVIEAVETLGEVKDPAAVTVLKRLAAAHPRQEARIEAIETLGEVAPPGVTEFFKERLAADSSEAVRMEILETLAEVGSDSAVAVLVEVARRHRDPSMRSEAFEQLGDMKHPRARDAIEQELTEP